LLVNFACQYKSGEQRFLDVYSIQGSWDSEDNQNTIPTPTIYKVSSIKFDDIKFLCFAERNSFFAINTKTNSIVYIDGKTQTPCRTFQIGKPFVSYFDYTLENINVYGFDGKTFYHIQKNDKMTLVGKVVIKESSGLNNTNFLPINSEHSNNCSGIILLNNLRCFVIDSYNGSVAYKQLFLGNKTLKFFNIAQNNDDYYHFDERQKTLTPIKIRPINMFGLFWSLDVDCEAYPTNVVVSGMFINLRLDQSNNDNPLVLFDYIDNLYICTTSGINEPVTEAYIAYENDMMSIYNMNDKSVYQCKLNADQMYYLKLQKLDLKPEPIKKH
jgi:hypothetical protein